MQSPMIPALLALAGCTTGHIQGTNAMRVEDRTITIELLALDLSTCGRCTGTDANLDAAIAAVADVLREGDVHVELRKTVVDSAEQAERLRFESSPTLRINGRDIALELRESNCGDCGDLCGCEGQVDCRVWVWKGEEHLEAPKALIIDAILRAYGQAFTPAPRPSTRFRLPDNLRRFFEARSRAAATAVVGGADGCDRTACCDPQARESCCGAAAGGETCGCGG